MRGHITSSWLERRLSRATVACLQLYELASQEQRGPVCGRIWRARHPAHAKGAAAWWPAHECQRRKLVILADSSSWMVPQRCLCAQVAKGRQDLLRRQVVKSNTATVTVPELQFEIPPATQKGGITTVEGLLTDASSGLRCAARPLCCISTNLLTPFLAHCIELLQLQVAECAGTSKQMLQFGGALPGCYLHSVRTCCGRIPSDTSC